MRILLTFLVCSSIGLNVFGQMSKNDMRQIFSDAEFHIINENYGLALPLYLELFSADPTNANYNYRIGQCYLKSSSEKTKSIPFLETAVREINKNYEEFAFTEKKAPEISIYLLAQAFQLNYQFDEAIAQYEKYRTLVKPKSDLFKEIPRRIEMCQTGKELVKAPVNSKIENLGDSINSQYPEYSPVISADEEILIFTSRRDISMGGQLTKDFKYFEDIYISYKVNGIWGGAQPIPTINTSNHEASIGLSADGQTLLIFKDDAGDGNIYQSKLEGHDFTFPEKMHENINSKAFEPSACLTPDGNTMYFVSERPGGFGGEDIYRSVKMANGDWSKAVNLGPSINTSFDEDGPFIHPDEKTLYFSSKGHKTMGGHDIFQSTLNETDNSWSQPVNIGYPINTPDDDVYIVTSPDARRGYYSSGKADGFGETDIYMITFLDQKEAALTLLKGSINLDGTGKLMSDVEILVTNIETEELEGIYRPIARNGNYTIILPPGNKYRIDYRVNDSTFSSEDIFVSEESAYQEMNKPVSLNKLHLDGHKTDETSKVNYRGFLVADNNLPLKNKKVFIRNEAGDVVQVVFTGENGSFVFRNLPADQNYILGLDGEDPELKIFDKIVINDQNGKLLFVSEKKPDLFAFKLLESEKNTYGGILIGEDNVPLKNKKIVVKNAKGEILKFVTTGEDGGFTFSNLKSDQNYIFSLDESDPDLKMINKVTLKDKSGKQLFISEKKPDLFRFVLLPSEKNTYDGILTGENNVPLNNRKIQVKNSKGEVLNTLITGPDGRFSLTNLKPDENYIFSIDENDPELKSMGKIVVRDKAGKQVVSNQTRDLFAFSLLSADKNTMGLITPAQTEVNFKGNIYGGNKSNLPVAGKKVNLTDESGKIVQTAETDAKGGFQFRSINPEINYMVTMEATDEEIKKFGKIIMRDKANHDVVLATQDKSIKNLFSFSLLNTEHAKMLLIDEVDPAFKAMPASEKPSESKSISSFMELLGYNELDINKPNGAFFKFMDYLSKTYKDSGVNLRLEASSSKLPTLKYGDNQVLSEKRAEVMRQRILAGAKERNMDPSKIKFSKIEPLVQGPEYDRNSPAPASEYKKFQYVKVWIE